MTPTPGTGESEDLASRLRRLEAKCALAEKLLESARAQLAATAHELLVAQNYAASLESQREERFRRMDELDAQCRQLTQVIEAQRTTIRELKSDFGWKLMTPFRTIRRWLGGSRPVV